MGQPKTGKLFNRELTVMNVGTISFWSKSYFFLPFIPFLIFHKSTRFKYCTTHISSLQTWARINTGPTLVTLLNPALRGTWIRVQYKNLYTLWSRISQKKEVRYRQKKWPPKVIMKVSVRIRNKTQTFQSNAFIRRSSQKESHLWLTLCALFPAVPYSWDSNYQLFQRNLRPLYYSNKPTFNRHKAESRSWLPVHLYVIAPQSKFMNVTILRPPLFVPFYYSPVPKI